MPEEKSRVTIVAWPAEPLTVEHRFDLDKPCAVSIAFDSTPANVVVATDPGRPIDVNMGMSLIARESIPVCIKLCEPICASSDYTVGMRIFDNPVARPNRFKRRAPASPPGAWRVSHTVQRPQASAR